MSTGTPVVVSRIQNRRGTQAQFDALYPEGQPGFGPDILQPGEIALITDPPGKVYIGSLNGTYFEIGVSSNNTLAGLTDAYNTLLGNSAGANLIESLSDNTGIYNVAVGVGALYSNTTAYNNVAIGAQALLNNTTASDNIAIGYESLQNNTTGSTNIAIGKYALNNVTVGNYNIAIGYNNNTGTSSSFINWLITGVPAFDAFVTSFLTQITFNLIYQRRKTYETIDS